MHEKDFQSSKNHTPWHRNYHLRSHFNAVLNTKYPIFWRLALGIETKNYIRETKTFNYLFSDCFGEKSDRHILSLPFATCTFSWWMKLLKIPSTFNTPNRLQSKINTFNFGIESKYYVIEWPFFNGTHWMSHNVLDKPNAKMFNEKNCINCNQKNRDKRISLANKKNGVIVQHLSYTRLRYKRSRNIYKVYSHCVGLKVQRKEQ